MATILKHNNNTKLFILRTKNQLPSYFVSLMLEIFKQNNHNWEKAD